MIDAGVAETEAKRIGEEEAKTGATFESIEEDYRVLAELEALAGIETADVAGKHSEAWNIRTATGIGIIREERYKLRREADYEAEQKRKAEAANRPKGR